jgi:hypothetical protein
LKVRNQTKSQLPNLQSLIDVMEQMVLPKSYTSELGVIAYFCQADKAIMLKW